MGTDPKHLLGTTLSGRYRIEKVIGEGGMGAIFQATQLSLGRAIAIKVVKCAHGDNAEAIGRFELETEVIARLAHPNIVQVVDAGRADDGTMYLAMELLEGDSIRAVVRKIGALPIARALAIVEDVASALAAAHAGGVIHRDLKAENVMLVRAAGKQEIAKVLDFGVAKLTTRTEAPPQTGSGFVAGTPGCIAPEQMLGKSDDPRSDLYSVGVLLFEMLTGEAPFTATSSVELMLRHLTEPAPRAADVARARGRPDVPGPVDELVAALLAKDPDARPASAEALVDIVASLRDAGRATQPDLRAPTPLGLAAPPTPLAPSLTPSLTQPTPHTPTALTSTVPVVAPQGPPGGRPRLLALRVAGVVVLAGVVLVGGLRAADYFADRDIPGWSSEVGDAWEKWDGIEEAFLKVDARGVRERASYVLDKGHEVPMAHLYLAQVAMMERASLTDVDQHFARAVESADRRARMSGRTHTQRLVAALAEIDPARAWQKWQEHIDAGCENRGGVEQHMFAAKLAFTYVDGAQIAETYRRVLVPPNDHDDTDGDEQLRIEREPPITRMGYARALRHQLKLDEAAALLAPLRAADPRNPILLDAVVDVELARQRPERAIELLEEYLAGSDDLRATIRLISLRSRADAKAFDQTLARVRSLVDRNPAKSASLMWIGYLFAARGRFAEADALWSEAAAVAGNDDTRVAEIGVFAAMLAAVGGDLELAERWNRVFQDRSLGLTESASTRRMQAFALANRIMIRAFRGTAMNDPAIAQDYKRLMEKKTDVPLLASTITWHVLIEQGKIEDAVAAAHLLPPCFRDAHLGMAYLKRGDAPAALLRFVAATTPELEAYCTSGDDVVPFIQSMQFAKALGYRANVAMQLGDRAGAQAAMDRLHAFWPFAAPYDATRPAQWQVYVGRVERWLSSAAPP